MHSRDQKSLLIRTLTEGHTITAACARAGVSRMFYDRHYKTDPKFRKEVDDARLAGRNAYDDLVTTVHHKKIRDGHWQALQYALKKQDEKKKEDPKPLIAQSDIRFLIEQLPEPYKSQHYRMLRELLDHSTEYSNTGKILPRQIGDL